MSVTRHHPTLAPTIRVCAGILVAALSGCSESPSEPVLGDRVTVQSTTLDVRGGSDPDDIRITVTGTAVQVQVGAASGSFEEPIQRIVVSGGAGDDVIRLGQSVVRDLDIDVAGGEGDDDVQLTFAPSGGGTAISVTAAMDGGAGSDALGLSWDSKGQDLDVLVSLTVEGTIFLPEVDDEVVVGFEGGDPDQPIIVGGAYNPSAPADPGATGDAHRLTFSASLSDAGPDVEVGVLGGIGRDDFTLEADYSGVVGQQGRIVLDADVGEGDNHVGTYYVTSVAHTYIESTVLGGGGRNEIRMEDTAGGEVERVYDVELGDGDNTTSIAFGDGIRGARLPTGQRSVTGAYRSGSGTNTVSLDLDLVEPLTSDFTLDLGEGTGSVVGRFDMPAEPASDPPPGAQPGPSQIKVLILSPNETDWDFVTTMADPDPDDGADEPGKITVTGSGVRGGRLDFLRLLDAPLRPAGGADAPADDWTIGLSDLATAGPVSVTATADGAVRRLIYLQEAVQVDAGASLDVTLQGHDGADAMLAHVLGVSGNGGFDLAMDGAAGADFAGALTRDLDPTGTGALTFDVLTGDGDDRAAAEAPTDLQRGGSVAYMIDAGAGTDACYASAVVAAQGCESREGITAELLQLLETLFGAELAAAWSGGG